MAVHARPVAMMHQMRTQHPAPYTVPHNAGRGFLSSRREVGSFFGGIVAPPPLRIKDGSVTPPPHTSRLSSLSLSAGRPRGRRDPSSKIVPMDGSQKDCVGLELFCPQPLSLFHASSPPVCAEKPRGERRGESCRAKRRKPEEKRRNPYLWGPRTGWRAAHKRDQA
jgi:hypothetical protein